MSAGSAICEDPSPSKGRKAAGRTGEVDVVEAVLEFKDRVLVALLGLAEQVL